VSGPDIDLDVHLAAIGAGDADAFALWVAGAEPPLRRSLASFAARVDVEAVLQEALLRVWQLAYRVGPDGRPNALLRWAHRVARNLALDVARARRETPDPDAAAELPGEDLRPAAPDPMLRARVVDCMEKLPGKPQQALGARLTSRGDEPDARLAERLGMTLNTFLQNFTRARRLLADCLRGYGVELP
jgi:RNA polymerase sigma-70 factor (ECF subfamily)